MLSFVMGNDEEAQQAFMEAEPRLLGHGDHVHEVMQTLCDMGIILDVVSELIRTVGPVDQNVILRFLTAHDLRRYFRYLITPLGKIDMGSGQGLTRSIGGTPRAKAPFTTFWWPICAARASPRQKR